MARVVRRETTKRGFLGWMFLIGFVGFNALMVAWLLSFWGGQLDGIDFVSEAERAIEDTVAGMILIFWVVGAVILGLFAVLTRGRRTIVEEYD